MDRFAPRTNNQQIIASARAAAIQRNWTLLSNSDLQIFERPQKSVVGEKFWRKCQANQLNKILVKTV